MGEQKFAFINAIAVSLLLLQFSFACNPAFCLNKGKKTVRTYIILVHMFILLEETSY